ncbi:hypothetical protein MVEN_00920900 [Mycena venus]|uniref:Uncharacterized protein n=1 Tax=Mycena venus TaxID=2733690 RepID=A0A8H6YBH6_9AGAR|nr:hypothetical protein MVEN_00920900 [Mycena venus]
MPLPRLFRSSTNEWVSPLITVARGLISVGNCVPFPYVNTALSAGLALLELIETVNQSGDDLKYLAESVVTIMKLLREEMDSHPTTENTNFHQVCEEFTRHLTQLAKDLESMSGNWSSSKFRKYLNSRNVRGEIALFTRRVNDLRANTTLIAATGARMEVAAVKSMVSELQRRLDEHPSTTIGSSDSLKQELVRFEEDFHALKMGDIHLDFGTARTEHFSELDYHGRERRRTGWTDYKAKVNGCIRTVRVYQGSDPTELWKGFLSFLADNSPSPHFPQLFGFCSSPRLRSLVFHGEYRTLDEYANTLSSARAIVDWELSLVLDSSHVFYEYPHIDFYLNRQFAMVNAQDGKLIFLHIDQSPGSHHLGLLPYSPFILWFMDFGIVGSQFCRLIDSGSHMREGLSSLVNLRRRNWMPHSNISEALLCLDRVYNGPTIVAQLTTRSITADSTWTVYHVISNEEDSDWSTPTPLPPMHCFPTAEEELRDGFTHFIVPLVGKTQKWVSWFDHKARCGYFLNAQIGFGNSVPDVSLSWMAQAQSILSKYSPSIECKPSNLCVPTSTYLFLHWEMVLAAEPIPTTEESWAIVDNLPENINVFVQVPTVKEARIEEPQIYWSTGAHTTETSCIPPGSLKIHMRWSTSSEVAQWEPHHYEVASAVLKEHGFDPTTNAAAESLNLPLFEIRDHQEPSDQDDSEFSWPRKVHAKDPHTLQEVDW